VRGEHSGIRIELFQAHPVPALAMLRAGEVDAAVEAVPGLRPVDLIDNRCRNR
jgi:hypothetical protein